MDRLQELIVWGVWDSMTPVQLAVWAWFGAACISKSDRRKGMLFFAIPFILIYYIFSLLFVMGTVNFLFMQKWYPHASRVVCVLLALWLIWVGLKFFVRWSDELRGSEEATPTIDLKILPLAGGLRAITAILLAMILAYASVIWAPTQYITIMALEAIYPGKGWVTLGAIAFYTFIKILLLICTVVGVFIVSKRGEQQKKQIFKTSMVYIVMSAFYLAIGSGIIYVFIKYF